MTIVYRQLEESEKEQYRHLSGYCFHMPKEDSEHYAKVFFNKEYSVAAFEGEKLISLAWYVPYRMHLEGEFYRMAGVSGVVTASPKRREGIVKEIMVRLQHHMRENGFFISYLFPFNWEFYRKMGWDDAMRSATLKFEPRDLKDFSADLEGVRTSDEWNVDDIRAVYHQYIRLWNGGCASEDAGWENRIKALQKKDLSCALFYEGREPVAWMIYRFQKGDKMNFDLSVRLWAVRSIKDFKALCQHLYHHLDQNKYIHLSGPGHFPYDRFLKNLWIERKSHTVTMVKVIDIEKALTQRVFPSSLFGELTLEVSGDPACPWNNRVFSLKFKDGHCGISEGGKPEVSLSIQTFSQLFAGHADMSELIELDLIKGDRKKAALLESIFPKRPFFFSEQF
ncbi:enhanced intracellular survival protein Eis [Acidobacteriota bacterium]